MLKKKKKEVQHSTERPARFIDHKFVVTNPFILVSVIKEGKAKRVPNTPPLK